MHIIKMVYELQFDGQFYMQNIVLFWRGYFLKRAKYIYALKEENYKFQKYLYLLTSALRCRSNFYCPCVNFCRNKMSYIYICHIRNSVNNTNMRSVPVKLV